MYCRLMRSDDMPRFEQMLSPGFRASSRVCASLPDLWRRLLANRQLDGSVVAETDPAQGESVLAFGMTTFVGEPFVDEYLRAPQPYLSALVYERVLDGRSPIVPSADLAALNAAGELNLLILHFGIHHANPGDERGRAIVATSYAGFRAVHLGYRIKRVLQEAYGPELPYFTAGGFLVKSDYALSADASAMDANGWRPYLVGLFRDDRESQLPGSAISYLFHSSPPMVHFSDAERHVVLRAVMDEPDDVIAEALKVSPEGVKKTWRRIHQRVDAAAIPELSKQPEEQENGANRGKERRRRLVQYLRYHPEALRPFARKGAVKRRS